MANPLRTDLEILGNYAFHKPWNRILLEERNQLAGIAIATMPYTMPLAMRKAAEPYSASTPHRGQGNRVSVLRGSFVAVVLMLAV